MDGRQERLVEVGEKNVFEVRSIPEKECPKVCVNLQTDVR